MPPYSFPHCLKWAFPPDKIVFFQSVLHGGARQAPLPPLSCFVLKPDQWVGTVNSLPRGRRRLPRRLLLLSYLQQMFASGDAGRAWAPWCTWPGRPIPSVQRSRMRPVRLHRAICFACKSKGHVPPPRLSVAARHGARASLRPPMAKRASPGCCIISRTRPPSSPTATPPSPPPPPVRIQSPPPLHRARRWSRGTRPLRGPF